MRKIKLITDSTSDLSKDIIEQYDIEVIPLYVIFGDEEYLDGVNINTKKLYELVEQKKMLPKSSAIAPGTFLEVFETYLEQGFDIIYCGLGRQFSGTYNSSVIAKNMIGTDRIHIIDSANLSNGIALLLMKAISFIEQGDDIFTVVSKVEELVPKVRSQFVIDTLDYLYKGGRLNALSAIAGKVLHIHPIIKVRDGVMIVGKKVRGSMLKAIKTMISDIVQLKEDIDLDLMMINNSIALEHFPYVIETMKEQFPSNEIFLQDAGCVISTHCGQGTIGIFYIEQ